MDRESRLTDKRSVTNNALRLVISLLGKIFPDVKLVTTHQLGNIIANLERSPDNGGVRILLLDIREEPEFKVSHIAGAEFINFMDSYSRQFQNAIDAIRKTTRNNTFNSKFDIYIYCAVGIRASMFTRGFTKYLKRMQVRFGSSVDRLDQRAADDDTLPYTQLDFHVVEGSIYKWAMENRPLVDNQEKETCIVHRCSKLWGLMFLDKKFQDSNLVPWII